MSALKSLLMLPLLILSIQHLPALPMENNGSFHWKSLETEVTQTFAKDYKAQRQNCPILILVAGFQGAGKSALLAHLRKIYDANVISTDAIRQSLFNRGVPISLEFSKCVSAISSQLLKYTLAANAHLFIDANAHAKRIKEIESALTKSQSKHTVIKIYLRTSEEVLRHRVRTRQSRSDCYQGTEAELEAALNSTVINSEDYDLIVDTDKINENTVFEQVNHYIISCLRNR
jgi:predicted kinase